MMKNRDFDQCLDTPSKKRRPQSQQSQTNLEVFLRIRPNDKLKSCSAKYKISNNDQSIEICNVSLIINIYKNVHFHPIQRNKT